MILISLKPLLDHSTECMIIAEVTKKITPFVYAQF